MNPFYEKFNALIASNQPFVSVTLVDATGSVPQERGAKMLVTEQGLHFGTVGGGKVETRALGEAAELLKRGDVQTRFFEWNLNKDIEMTCGGSVKFFFEAFNVGAWHITVFGAGHVGQALVNLLLNLDCRVTWIDPRPEWLSQIPDTSKLHKIQTDHMPGEVKNIPEGSFVVLMTMGHTTDKPILLELLKVDGRYTDPEKPGFPYIGVIGSQAKAIQLKKDIVEAGLPKACEDAFYCPIGLDIGNNHPQEIAVSVVAQLLEKRGKTGCS